MGEPTQRAKVLKARDLCHSVRELVLSPLEWVLSFKPGQWVSLKLPVGEHPPLTRAYSMAEPESPSGQLVLAFDRVPEGLGSGYLFSLNAGDEVIMSGPYGNFMAPQPLAQDLVFIARFTGIVPIRCILKQLFTARPSGNVTLIYGAPSRAELIYHDEFTTLAAGHDSFRYVPTVLDESREETGEGRSELEILKSLWEGRKNFLPMVSGTKAFVRPLKTYFTELGFERKEARFETYD